MQITSSLLTRNVVLSFMGNLVPLALGIVTIPVVVNGLGPERFGILAIVGIVLGYFTLFDLGIGRATVRFVAQAKGKSEGQMLLAFVWTGLTLNALLGVVGGAVLASVTPLLVDHVLNIPPGLVKEARETLFLLAASLPVVLLLESLRGVLEAGQRFDLVNAVKVPLALLTSVIPAASVLIGFSLPAIMLLLWGARVFAAVAYFVLCLRVYPDLREGILFEPRLLYPLLSFGGWLTVSTAVGMLMYFDRFLIASLLSISAVTHYTIPSVITAHLLIIPNSLLTVLFPAINTLAGSQELVKVRDIAVRSLKYLLLLMGPLSLIVVFFANDLLTIWLGSEFAEQSTLVLQILAVGVLAGSLSLALSTLLQSVGRPDIPSKIHAFVLIGFLGTSWLLIAHVGLAGAAIAWTLQATIGGGLLFGACIRLKLHSFSSLGQHGLVRSICAVGVLAGVLGVSLPLVTAAAVRLVILVALLAVFAFVAWRWVADATERATIARMWGPIIRVTSRTE